MKVAVGSSSFGQADPRPIEALQEAGLTVVLNPFGRRLGEEEIVEHLKGAVGLIAGLEPLTRPVMEAAPDLRAIARVGIGMDNVNSEAAKSLGIRVSNTPNEPAAAVAELTMAAALALCRKLIVANEAVHSGRWEKVIGKGLCGSTVLIIGYGRIGRSVARLMDAFGALVLVADPFLSSGDLEHGHDLVDLPTGLSSADVVTVHADGKEILLGEEEFRQMKEGAILLNAARGHLVDERVLLHALRSGRLEGAWFDVFWEEPYFGELTKFKQVLLTPHIGTYTHECRLSMEQAAVDNLLRDLEMG